MIPIFFDRLIAFPNRLWLFRVREVMLRELILPIGDIK